MDKSLVSAEAETKAPTVAWMHSWAPARVRAVPGVPFPGCPLPGRLPLGRPAVCASLGPGDHATGAKAPQLSRACLVALHRHSYSTNWRFGTTLF